VVKTSFRYTVRQPAIPIFMLVRTSSVIDSVGKPPIAFRAAARTMNDVPQQ
jgi:hypothetical protein